MARIAIDSARQKLVEAGKIRGLSQKEAELIADDLLDAEMSGSKTHGVAKLAVINEAIRNRRGSPKVIKDASVYALVDGQGELGQLATNYCVDLLIPKAQEHGLGLVALKNASRYGRLTPYARRIASSGLVAIITNSAGPAAVAPYGSYAPILGTNPICIALPHSNDPVVMDFATSETVWGEIRRAILEGRDLPPQTFYKSDGAYAVHPQEANAVRAFGGAKGYALCFAIEVLCGAFVGAKMGLAVDSEYDLGFLFFALDPRMFLDDVDTYYAEVTKLADDIRQSPAINPGDQVRLPGDRSLHQKKQCLLTGVIEIADGVWDMVCKMADDPQAGLVSTNLTD